MTENAQHAWRRDRLLLWLCGIAIVSLLLMLGFPLIMLRAYEAGRKQACRNNLKQIQIALQNYHATNKSFPPAITYGPDGQPWHSWRALLVPFLESSSFVSEYKFDEPWNGPNNRRISWWQQCLPVFRCPSDASSDRKTTSYVAVIGSATLWPSVGSSSLQEVKSPTISVVEVHESGVHWLEPRDLRFDQMSFEINQRRPAGIRSSHHTGGGVLPGEGGANVIIFNSEEEESEGPEGCLFLSEETSPEELQELLTIKNEATSSLP